jgi:hypothetical protein
VQPKVLSFFFSVAEVLTSRFILFKDSLTHSVAQAGLGMLGK